MGYGGSEAEVGIDAERQRISVLINDGRIQEHLPHLTASLELVLKLIAKKNDWGRFSWTSIIIAKSGSVFGGTRQGRRAQGADDRGRGFSSPMNSYERRLIHMELSSRPDVKTDSVGEGKDRHIVVRLL